MAGELLTTLRPYSGTLVGFDSGALYLGSMDARLADLAELRGDGEAARSYRVAADLVVRRVRAEVDAMEVRLDFRERVPQRGAAVAKTDCA
ncbi:hypothetical protein ACWEP5_31710 [Nocardia niigatensis]